MSRRPRISVVLTCEHAGHQIPASVKKYFVGAEEVLQSHRGWDPGALPLARQFASQLGVPLAFSTVSRLVVELNRSAGHPRLFSEFTRELPADQRTRLFEQYWTPHRTAVEQDIAKKIASGSSVVHLSVHTFTQYFGTEVRTTDIGLLYDPRRTGERHLCSAWRDELQAACPAWKIRRNHPYKGSSDGFTTSLRKRFDAEQYLGIELEVCQKFFLTGGPGWKKILTVVPETFQRTLQDFSPRS